MYRRIYCKECEKAIKENVAYSVCSLSKQPSRDSNALRSINTEYIVMNKLTIPDVPKVVIIFRLKEKNKLRTHTFIHF